MRKYWIGALLAAIILFMHPASALASVNDFTITNYDINYSLGRDSANRSTLTTTEKITALFPDINQNHGIERALVTSYDNHSTTLKLTSITDETGRSLPYSSTSSGDLLLVRIGEAGTYVHGVHTYVITYSQRDVTKYFTDTGRDEFYWDTNGTAWQVPIQQLSVTLAIDPSISAKLTGNQACYQGASGSTATCALTPNESSSQFTVAASSLSPGENVTIAIGFAKTTFQPYQQTLFEKVFLWWLGWQFASGVVTLIVLIILGMRAVRRYRPKLYAIVPEFIPPKNTDIQTAALVAGQSTKMFSAQIIDLAVRHYAVIHLVKEKSLFGPAEYEIEIIKSVETLLPEEFTFISTLFGGEPSVGSRLNLNTLKNNTILGAEFMSNRQKLVSSLTDKDGYWASNEADRAYFKRAAGILAIIGLVTLSIPFLFTSLMMVIIAFVLKSMTEKGLTLYRYVEGLKLYIGAAEAEQLRMLQSPEGADKVGDLADGSQKIILYERLLPYAVLLSLEKNWSKALGDAYAANGVQPGWYDGGTSNMLFNAAILNSVVSNMNSSLTTYSSSSGFSSSGGSGGGGFSGGGGGGGGGGGW